MPLPLAGGLALLGRLVPLGVRQLLKGRIAKWFYFYLSLYLGGIIGKVLWLVGVTLVVNKFATPVFRDLIAGKLLGLPPDWVAFIGLTRADQAITIVLSAVAIRMADQVKVKARQGAWQQPL